MIYMYRFELRLSNAIVEQFVFGLYVVVLLIGLILCSLSCHIKVIFLNFFFDVVCPGHCRDRCHASGPEPLCEPNSRQGATDFANAPFGDCF